MGDSGRPSSDLSSPKTASPASTSRVMPRRLTFLDFYSMEQKLDELVQDVPIPLPVQPPFQWRARKNQRKHRRREYLTQEEIDKLLEASKTASRNPARDYAILLLMFRHGLRVSELCSMKLSDVNVETKEFHVQRLKGCDSGSHELYNREAPAIKAWLVERAKMNPPVEVETLFISERRKPLSRVTVWLMINPGRDRCGARPPRDSSAHAAA
jgi:site-specific recombinase XerD